MKAKLLWTCLAASLVGGLFLVAPVAAEGVPTTESASGTVSAANTTAPDVVGNGQAARDPNGDGIYEDIDGDRTFDLADIQALFDNLGDPSVTGNSSLFDLTATSEVNILDVQALFTRLQAGLDVGPTPTEKAKNYLSNNNANGYDGTVLDKTGQDSVTIAVGQGGLQYGPVAVEVSPGTTVTWNWVQGRHNVNAEAVPDGGVDLYSGRAASDDTYSETLETTGAYRYFCNPHKGFDMYGAVIVTE